MKCETCQKNFDAEKADIDIRQSYGENIEIEVKCPHCKQGYYEFVPLAGFTLDESMPGTPEEDES